MVGTGRGAECGILIKNGESLENAHRIDTVVFDKTGTLTMGKPEVTEVIPCNDFNPDDILKYAASAEKDSEHSLGDAIVRAALERNIETVYPRIFKTFPGLGVEAVVSNLDIKLGNKKLMVKHRIDIGPLDETAKRLSTEGKTPVYVSIDHTAAGIISVADTIKENSRDVVVSLNKIGIETVMITGDSEGTAQAVAKKLGIEKTLSEILPEGKAIEIKKIQGSGRIVAMVGDGINDAVALTQADVGISIGSGTDVAMEASDITLINDDLQGVMRAIELSKKTMRTIKWNLFWAFAYNTMGIPIAAGVLYPFFKVLLNPMIASAAMALSSVLVVANSLRLKKVQI